MHCSFWLWRSVANVFIQMKVCGVMQVDINRKTSLLLWAAFIGSSHFCVFILSCSCDLWIQCVAPIPVLCLEKIKQWTHSRWSKVGQQQVDKFDSCLIIQTMTICCFFNEDWLKCCISSFKKWAGSAMRMGLLPLEFTECLQDSPYFRDSLHSHEKELERTSNNIKELIKQVKNLLNAAKGEETTAIDYIKVEPQNDSTVSCKGQAGTPEMPQEKFELQPIQFSK